LLSFSRKQIEGYVCANKVPYRDDSSNASSDYKRNRIRNEVFPIFEKVNPSFIRSINREMSYFSEASDIVEDWCRTQIPDLVNDAGQQDALRINLPALLSRKHWRYLLYYMLDPYGFNSQTLASLENLLDSDRTSSGKRFESLSHDLFVERTELVVINKDENKVGALSRPAGEVCMPVRGAGIYNFNGLRWQVELMDWREDMPLKQAPGTLIADADKLVFPFVCRRWSQGDWFIPLGMRGRKKVSDLFTDLKYGTFRKEMAVMMVDCRGDLAESQHIAGVLGVRLDDAYKVDKNTKSIIRITILNNTKTL
jgi:tRNA(Ile)-lysidine synthase